MPDGTIRIMCPSLTCRKILAVPVSSRGKTVRCKNCGGTIRVPQKQEAAQAPVAAGAAGKSVEGAPQTKA
jgi:hypothetical protein